MEKELDVLVVGELNADLILQGDVVPVFGQVEKLVDDATLTIGSSSAIFACGVARLGLRVAFVGKVGDDPIGRFMCDALAARGIDTRGVVVDPILKTGLSVILSRGADRAILTYLGTIAALRATDVDRTLLARARHLHMGSYFLHEALLPDIPRLFAETRAHGLTISLDTNYDPAERWDSGVAQVLPDVDLFFPNQTELCAIAGTPEADDALARLAAMGPSVAVKLGADGAIARHGAVVVTAPSIPVQVVDTTGAGDSFDAGYVYGHLAGWQPARTLRFACVCGALSTQAAGGTVAQPTLEEALAWMG
jgi:sugar/nucleoside kinase (ribokinase family)